MARADRPTEAEKNVAEHALEEAISKFDDNARAPWERGKPNIEPTWVPRKSTLRFSYLKNGGWIWAMEANDQQIVAYWVAPTGQEAFGRVTAHGGARNAFYNDLKARRIYPTESPWREWYDYMARLNLDADVRRVGL